MKKSNQISRKSDRTPIGAQAKQPDRKPDTQPDRISVLGLGRTRLSSILNHSQICALVKAQNTKDVAAKAVVSGAVESWLQLPQGMNPEFVRRFPGIFEEGNMEFLLERGRKRASALLKAAFQMLAHETLKGCSDANEYLVRVDYVAAVALALGLKSEAGIAKKLAESMRVAERSAEELAIMLDHDHTVPPQIEGYVRNAKIVATRTAKRHL